MTRVAAVQLNVSSAEEPGDRVDRAFAMIDSAAGQGAELVILPELWPSGGFDVERGVREAEPLDGKLATRLSEAATRNGIWLHGGSFVERAEGGRFCNTSALFDTSGELIATYRKIHLFGFEAAEAELLTAGSEVVVVDTPLGATALATCYDLRFPELFRAFVDVGATAVLITSAWPASRIGRWSLLARARAVENVMLVVGCNEVGLQGTVTLGGRSIMCDPWGDVVAEADDTEQILVADLDAAQPEAVRADFPVLQDRRLGRLPIRMPLRPAP